MLQRLSAFFKRRFSKQAVFQLLPTSYRIRFFSWADVTSKCGTSYSGGDDLIARKQSPSVCSEYSVVNPLIRIGSDPSASSLSPFSLFPPVQFSFCVIGQSKRTRPAGLRRTSDRDLLASLRTPQIRCKHWFILMSVPKLCRKCPVIHLLCTSSTFDFQKRPVIHFLSTHSLNFFPCLSTS